MYFIDSTVARQMTRSTPDPPSHHRAFHKRLISNERKERSQMAHGWWAHGNPSLIKVKPSVKNE